MKAGEKIINIANQELWYSENPPGSNQTKYGKWFGFDGVAWCGMFVSWVYYHAGYPLGNIGFSKGYAGCGTAYDHFKKTGEIVSYENAQPGDIILFDWNRDSRFDHTGILVSKVDGDHFKTIEGNTSANNQSNGGQVQPRDRYLSKANIIFVHPKILK